MARSPDPVRVGGVAEGLVRVVGFGNLVAGEIPERQIRAGSNRALALSCAIPLGNPPQSSLSPPDSAGGKGFTEQSTLLKVFLSISKLFGSVSLRCC